MAKSAKRSRPRRSRASWQETVEQWKGSGFSQVKFCEQNDLVLATFGWWYRRLKRDAAVETPPPSPEANEFVAVRLTNHLSEPPLLLELALPGGAHLRVPPGCDRQSLVEVLRALEAVGRC